MVRAWAVVVLVALSYATATDPLDAVWIQALVEAGATPEEKAAKRTPLDKAMHLAAWNGNVVAIKALLEAGAFLDGQDEAKLTALHQAAGRGHHFAVIALAEAGAPLEAQADSKQRTQTKPARFADTHS